MKFMPSLQALGLFALHQWPLPWSQREVRGIAEKLQIDIGAENAFKKAGKEAAKAEKEVSRFDRTVEKTSKSLLKWLKMKWQMAITIIDEASPVLEKLKEKAKAIGGKAWTITLKAVDLATVPIRGIVNFAKKAMGKIDLKDAIDSYAKFETAMSRIKVVSGASNKELDQLTATAERMAGQTKYSAAEVADAFHLMYTSGWETQDILNGIKGIMDLSAVSGQDLSAAFDITANTLDAFGLKASDSAHIADVLANASKGAGTDIQGMGDILNSVSEKAGALRLSIEDISLALGLMTGSGLKASDAGGALNTLLTALSKNTGKTAAVLKKLGIEFIGQGGSAKSLKAVIDDLRRAAKGMTEEEKEHIAKTLAGAKAQEGFLAILNTTSKDYKKLEDSIYQADGALKNMSDDVSDNLLGAFMLLQSAVDGVKRSLGERLSPYLKDLSAWITENMPDIEAGLGKFMDFVDETVEEFKDKIAALASTEEWEISDIFGKISIAWDKIIGEPFSEWWDTTGQELIAEKAGSIGEILGTGLSMGLQALLGIGQLDMTGEGANIGASFGKGFSQGFDADAVADKIKMAVKGIFSSIGKFLPGGEKPDLTSWISAIIMAKPAMSLLKIGMNGFNLGKTVLSGGKGSSFKLGPVLKKLWGSFSLANETAGIGNAAGSGIAGTLGKAGLALGSGASTSTGLIAAGGGAIAGGTIAAATAASGGMDLYRGFHTRDSMEAAAYKKSGGYKFTGVGAGALAGALIGSWFGGIGAVPGALIGAGIGGIGGLFAGDKTIKKYELSKSANRQATRIFAAEHLKNKFESQDFINAWSDTGVSGDELGKRFQKAVGQNLKNHFGDIALSLKEAGDLSKRIVFNGQEDEFARFSHAAKSAKTNLDELEYTVEKVNKLNWNAGLGYKLSEEETDSYKKGMEQLAQDVKNYAESKHVEASMSFELLLGEEAPRELISGIDKMYEKVEKRIKKRQDALATEIEEALKDGKITSKEQKGILSRQRKVLETKQQMDDANTAAKLDGIKVKYSGADLEADSYFKVHEEVAALMEESQQGYGKAFEIGVKNIKLMYDNDIISKEQYEEFHGMLEDAYNKGIEGSQLRVKNFELDTLLEAYNKELENILPEIEGTTSERLLKALESAIKKGVDTTAWDQETAAKLLGLEGLKLDTQAAVISVMSQLSESLFKGKGEESKDSKAGSDMSEAIKNSDLINQFSTGFSTAFEEGDFTMMKEAIGLCTGNAIKDADKEAIQGGIQLLHSDVAQSINNAFSSGLTANANVKVNFNYTYGKLWPGLTLNTAFNPEKNAKDQPKKNAEGSIVTSPILSWIGEDGPEAIIPLGGKRRSRGLDLWERAGELLGVRRMLHSAPGNGGELLEDTSIKETEPSGIPLSDKNTHSNSEIKIDIKLSPSFQVNGESSNGDIVGVIKKNLKEMADELGAEIAESLGTVFSNMPKVAV